MTRPRTGSVTFKLYLNQIIRWNCCHDSASWEFLIRDRREDLVDEPHADLFAGFCWRRADDPESVHSSGAAFCVCSRRPALSPLRFASASGMALTFSLVAIAAAFGGHWVVRLNQGGRYVAMVIFLILGISLLFPSLAEA